MRLTRNTPPPYLTAAVQRPTSRVGWLACILLAISPTVHAAEPGPTGERVLGQATLVGELFCDDDENGRPSTGEHGIGGVRIVADHGWQALSDADGRFHLERFDPGQHLIKLDVASLPPWATPIGSSRRRFLATGGLVDRIRFPLKCTYEVVRPERLDLGEKTPALPSAPLVTISGGLAPLSIHFDGRPYTPLTADMRLRRKGQRAARGLNTPWRPGVLDPPVQILLKTDLQTSAKATWRVEVNRMVADGQLPIRVFHGQGQPPKSLDWDGTNDRGARSVVERGGLYTITFRVTDGHGQAAEAPPTSLGLSYGAESAELERRVLRSTVLDDPETSSEEIVGGLEGLTAVLRTHKDALVLVEVHTDDSMPTEVAITRSRRDAFVLVPRVAEVLNLPADRVFGVGYGPTRPIRPNINEVNRALNRRIEVALLPPGALGQVPVPEAKSAISVQGLQLTLDAKSTFLRSLEESHDQMTINAQLPNGGRWQAVVSLNDLAEAADSAAIETDPLRSFGGKALREALGDPMVASRDTTHDTAEDIVVYLPSSDAHVASPDLFVKGHSHPANALSINGQPVPLDARGDFALNVPLKTGENTLDIVSKDKAGRTARISRSLQVSSESYFILALADAASGSLEAHLPGRSSDSAAAVGPVFLQGRGAAVFRGRISGTVIAEHLNFVGHLDTNKHTRFRSFIDQVIDPLHDYSVYGDSASMEQVGTARGPLYILIEADKSHALAGNFRTDIEGLELLRYDRALYGGVVHLDRTWKEGWTTKARVFGSEDVSRLRREHDELHATGGSLYYLSAKPVLEGSERLDVVIREQGSGLVLERRTLRRDHDYRIDYLDGRVHLKSPLSAVSATTWGLSSFQVATDRAVLQGNGVYLVADYEAEDAESTGQYAIGVDASQQIFGMAEIGGSFVQEGRSGDDGSYTLFGADTTVDVWDGTRINAEIAGALGRDGDNSLSRDGGLTFLNHEPSASRYQDGEGTDGYAFKLGVDSRPGKWFANEDLNLHVRSWWELVDTGFHAVGHTLDQGKQRFGGEAVYRPTDVDEVRVRVDGTRWEAVNRRFPGGLGMLHRYWYAAQYARQLGAVRLSVEAAYGEHRDDEDGQVFHTGGFLAGAHWQVVNRLGLFLNQESLVGGDDKVLGRGLGTRQTTRLGLEYAVMEDLALMIGTAIRWDGDHAIQLGARTRADDGTDVYIHEEVRPAHGGHGASSATVVGTERQLEDGGRLYSEYRLGGVANGMANRSVLGIAKRFALGPGVNLAAGYERSQSVGGYEGIGSRDVLSLGLEILATENLRYGGRYEIRLDHMVEPPEGIFRESSLFRKETIQAVLSNGLSWRISPEVTAMATVRMVFNQDLVTREILREVFETSAAVLWKPAHIDWLNLTGRYTRAHRRWLLVDEASGTHDEADIFGVTALFDLPWRLRVTDRLLFRHHVTDAEDTESMDEFLWINHAAMSIVYDIDIAAEYRLWAPLEGDVGHGALLELGYTLLDYARIGVGYDFSSIPRDLTLDAESGSGGVYVRLTGTY